LKDECFIKLNWAAPNDGGSPITEYFVELQGKDAKFYPLEGASCVGPNKKGIVSGLTTSCSISIPALFEAPYLLEEKDQIKIRVTATNEIGSATPSEINSTAASLTKRLSQMDTPEIQRKE